MPRFFSSLSLFALGAVLALPPVAQAHDSYIQQRFGGWTLVNAHGADEDDAYRVEKLRNVAAHDGIGASVAVRLDDKGDYSTLVAEDASALAVSYYSGFWTKDTADEWHNGDTASTANPAYTGEYARHAVGLIAPSDRFVPFGLPLEIVPLADPMAREAGDMVPVQVLYDGTPLAGAEIGSVLPGVAMVTTDAEGKAKVTVNEGHNILLVVHKIAHPDAARADEQSHEATLSFVPKHDHDH